MPKINLSTYIALALLIGGLVFVVIPKGVQNTVSPSSAPQASSGKLVKVKKFDIVIKGGKIDGQNTLSVLQGETVRFGITADEDGEFKINGLNKSLTLEKDKQGVLFVTSQSVGGFPMVFKDYGEELGILEIFSKP